MAKENGAGLVIIKLTETTHDKYADVVINETLGKTLTAIISGVKDGQ